MKKIILILSISITQTAFANIIGAHFWVTSVSNTCQDVLRVLKIVEDITSEETFHYSSHKNTPDARCSTPVLVLEEEKNIFKLKEKLEAQNFVESVRIVKYKEELSLNFIFDTKKLTSKPYRTYFSSAGELSEWIGKFKSAKTAKERLTLIEFRTTTKFFKPLADEFFYSNCAPELSLVFYNAPITADLFIAKSVSAGKLCD